MRSAQRGNHLVQEFSQGEVGILALDEHGRVENAQFPFWRDHSFEYVCENVETLLAEWTGADEPTGWEGSE